MYSNRTHPRPDPEPDPVEEDDGLVEWEVQRMLELGVPYDDAVGLARAGVSWHRVDDLVRGGCDPALTVRVLA